MVVCVMCRKLHGNMDTCVTGCYYSALVAQGVVNHVQLAQICTIYKPTFIHSQMTDVPPEDRDYMIQAFWYRYWARSRDPLRGAMGIFHDLSAELADKIADVQKLEDQLAHLKLANNEKHAAAAAENVSDVQRLKLEDETEELQLVVKIIEKKKEAKKVEDELVEHNNRMTGRRMRNE